jgi:hypothetical protein
MLEDLRTHYEGHDMKAFYATAERVLRIKHGNPVVKVVLVEDGDVISDRDEVNKLIGEYFHNIYKAPDRMEDIADTCSTYQPASSSPITFTDTEVREAMTACNFNKGLGPDGFHGGILRVNDLKHTLTNNLVTQIRQFLNDPTSIPEYLREGRLVPLSKNKGKDQALLKDIRPIVVRYHLAKILEKAALAKIEQRAPHLLATTQY